MSFSVKISKNIVVNGKTYGDPDEMPPDVRAIYDTAMKNPAGILTSLNTEKQVSVSTEKQVSTGFSFNGTEYGSPDEMPPDVRRAYDDVMEKVKSGFGGAVAESGRLPGSPPPESGRPERVRQTSFTMKGAPAAERSPAAKWFIIGLTAGILTAVLYVIFRKHV